MDFIYVLVGSIFNRFSMDMGLLDENLPTTLQVSVVVNLNLTLKSIIQWPIIYNN